MNKNIVMLLAALMSLSAGETVFARSKKAKEHKHHGGYKRHNAHEKRRDRAMLMEQYRAMRQVELERAMEAGKFADLYKSPAWGVASLFHDKKWELSVNADYSYACDAYGSSGGGSNSNVTRLAFGEAPIRLQDILLASRLVAQNAAGVAELDPSIAPGAGAGAVAVAVPPQNTTYLNRTANDIVTLVGKVESYGVNLCLARYVVANNISIGMDMPILYKRNRLNAEYDFTLQNPLSNSVLSAQFNAADIVAIAPIGPAAAAAAARNAALAIGNARAAFLNRYGNNPQRYLKDILAAKGINELGGSAAGLGDVSMFVSGHIDSAHFDKLVVGARWQAPTGKKQSMNKLWSPDLGNGGFTELSVFGNALVSYKKYCNPHISLSAGCSLPAHVDRRVPKVFDIVGTAAGVGHGVNTLANGQNLAFGDRITLAAGNSIKALDSLVPNFGDTVSRVRIVRGGEVKMRLGNMVERFVSRRGFLDVFYDFRAKMKDLVSGLSANDYDVESVRRYSNQLEHRFGFDYSYQFDATTRMRLGTRYTVAGMNVPKTFNIAGSLNYDF